ARRVDECIRTVFLPRLSNSRGEKRQHHCCNDGRSKHGRWSTIQPRHRANRRTGAALDLDREADEAEATLADQLVEIDQPFIVGEAEVAPDMMHFEVVAAWSARADRFDAKHADTFL